MNFLHIVFWISFSAILYTSVLYIVVLKIIRKNHYKKDSDYLPTVSLIICAYNEEKNVAIKLENTLTRIQMMIKPHMSGLRACFLHSTLNGSK